MKPRHSWLALMSFLTVSVAVGATAPAPPTPPLPEYGFRGMKRVEVVFVNVGPSGVAGVVAPQQGSTAAGIPADDLVSRDLKKDPECLAIGKTLSNAGLEIVASCKADDGACGQLYLTVTNQSSERVADRIYLMSATLSQPVRLERDKKVDLAMSSTWATHRVAVVATNESATTAACMDLRSLATWLGSSWRIANR